MLGQLVMGRGIESSCHQSIFHFSSQIRHVFYKSGIQDIPVWAAHRRANVAESVGMVLATSAFSPIVPILSTLVVTLVFPRWLVCCFHKPGLSPNSSDYMFECIQRVWQIVKSNY